MPALEIKNEAFMKSVKTVKAVKTVKTVAPVVEFRIWCDLCCIRIAPHEERNAVNGKTYHPRCYSKTYPASAKAKQ